MGGQFYAVVGHVLRDPDALPGDARAMLDIVRAETEGPSGCGLYAPVVRPDRTGAWHVGEVVPGSAVDLTRGPRSADAVNLRPSDIQAARVRRFAAELPAAIRDTLSPFGVWLVQAADPTDEI